jgi:hypothetical protein
MPVLADLPVGLPVEMGGGDEYPELPVPEPRDQTACLANADAVILRVALGFKGELDRHRIRGRAK